MLNLALMFPDPVRTWRHLDGPEHLETLETFRKLRIGEIARDWAFVEARKGHPESDPDIIQSLDELREIKRLIAKHTPARATKPTPARQPRRNPQQLCLWAG